MLAFTDDIWKVLAALVIFAITAIVQGLQKARQSRRETGDAESPAGSSPTWDTHEPWAGTEPSPAEPLRPSERRPADDWKADLPRLRGGDPPPVPPPPVVVQIPSPPPPPPPLPAPPARPARAPKMEPAPPRVSTADAALTRLVGRGHAPAAFQHRPAQRPAPPTTATARTASQLVERWRDPRNAREAVIASLILGPPRSLEEG